MAIIFIFPQCLFHLSQWEQLEEAAVGAVDDADNPNLSKVWEDTFLQVS